MLKRILKPKILAINLASLLIFSGSLWLLNPKPAQAIPGLNYAVGGRFAPGLFDIFTPSFCGPLVTVIGPRPGVFIFAPMIYRNFYLTPWHVGLNMVGNSVLTPPCPPTLYMLGSSELPGF
jgi:hypothetical protein